MFGGKALGWMAGPFIWMAGAPGKHTLYEHELLGLHWILFAPFEH